MCPSDVAAVGCLGPGDCGGPPSLRPTNGAPPGMALGLPLPLPWPPPDPPRPQHPFAAPLRCLPEPGRWDCACTLHGPCPRGLCPLAARTGSEGGGAGPQEARLSAQESPLARAAGRWRCAGRPRPGRADEGRAGVGLGRTGSRAFRVASVACAKVLRQKHGPVWLQCSQRDGWDLVEGGDSRTAFASSTGSVAVGGAGDKMWTAGWGVGEGRARAVAGRAVGGRWGAGWPPPPQLGGERRKWHRGRGPAHPHSGGSGNWG